MAIALRMQCVVMIPALIALVGCYPRPRAVIGLANAATDYCAAIGGQSDTRQDARGRQFGFCRLPGDDRICELWRLFRNGSCVPPPGGKGWERPE